MEKIQSIRGMKDILPDESWLWQKVENIYRATMAKYNYEEIRTPILEKTLLFARSIGEETDIVGKEMYTFVDKGGEELSLRPEGTAGVVRAYIQHSMSAFQPVTKLFYIGPMFRRERPQKGRFRQFHQAGAEIFGAGEPFAEIEQILMLLDFLNTTGVSPVTIICNHLGTPQSRKLYTEELVRFFTKHRPDLCEDCIRRLETNPLRILDCKQPQCIQIIASSPPIENMRPDISNRMLEQFLSILKQMGVNVVYNSRLVRGLDYYTGIVFEGVVPSIEEEDDESQSHQPLSIVGGGRYDELVGQLGGQKTQAVGFAIGLERIIDICRGGMEVKKPVEIFIANTGEKTIGETFKTIESLRKAGFLCDFDQRVGSLKSQLKRADKIGAKFVVFIGEEEIASGKLKIKNMETGSQSEVNMENLISTFEEVLRH